MKDSLSLDRIRDAGADVSRILETSVLIKVGEIDEDQILTHPVFALSRGLAALDFRAVYLCGCPDYFDVLDETIRAGHFEQCPGIWISKEMALISPPANVIIDLTNDAVSHSFCKLLSCIRRSHCLYLFWDPSSAGISPTAFSEQELLKLHPGNKGISEIPAPICRIAAGIALQEIVMFAGKMELAAPLENSVSYNPFNGSPSQKVNISKMSEPIQNATVDVIGAGALGVHLLESLIPMLGSGCTLRIFDPDKVGPENIALQAPYTLPDVGKAKAVSITEKVQQIAHSDVAIEPFVMRYEDRPTRLSKPSLRIACPDSFATRKLLNDLSLKDKVPLAEAGTSPFAAQQRSYLSGATACLQCRIQGLDEKAEQEKSATSCIENRTLPGVNMIAGGILALEALKLLDCERGSPSAGTITFDARVPQRFGITDILPQCRHENSVSEK